MNKSPVNKKIIAHEIQTQLDLLFSQVTQNKENAASYHDVCKITDWIKDALFKETDEFPPLIDGAISLARSLVNPSALSAMDEMRKGMGLLVVTAGGLAVAWGIMLSLGVTAGVWAHIVTFFTGSSIVILGPIAIAAGLASLVAGLYVVVSVTPMSVRSAKAHDTLTNAINAWAQTEEASKKADAEVVRSMQEAVH